MEFCVESFGALYVESFGALCVESFGALCVESFVERRDCADFPAVCDEELSYVNADVFDIEQLKKFLQENEKGKKKVRILGFFRGWCILYGCLLGVVFTFRHDDYAQARWTTLSCYLDVSGPFRLLALDFTVEHQIIRAILCRVVPVVVQGVPRLAGQVIPDEQLIEKQPDHRAQMRQ